MCTIYILVFLILFGLSVQVECDDSEVYVKFTKNTPDLSLIEKESWELWSNNEMVFRSSDFSSNPTVIETCIKAITETKQYDLRLKVEDRSRWHAGSWLSIEGIYGNIFFKNFLFSSSAMEEYPLSLYYAFVEDERWKIYSGIPSESWNDAGFEDGSWSTKTVGSFLISSWNTQYLRKSFGGIPNMAAYELRLKYKVGLVAYINGEEIYRDNMPEGPVSFSTLATGQYSTVVYRSTIRPGSEVAHSISVLAVEIHFKDTSSTTPNVDFNGFLALLTSSIPSETGNCFIYPYEVQVSSGSSLFDFNYQTFQNVKDLSSRFPLSGTKVLFNGIQFLSSETFTIPVLKWQARNSNWDEWTELIHYQDQKVHANSFTMINDFFYTGIYSNYQLVIEGLANEKTYYEIQPLVCNIQMPTNIQFSQSLYSYYIPYDPVNIHPTLPDFTDCSISPAPPSGLSFDTVTCSLTGTFESSQSPTSYLVTSTVHNKNYTGVFLLEARECTGTLVEFERVFKEESNRETYLVEDANGMIIVDGSEGQINSQTISTYRCLTGVNYFIEMDCEMSAWVAGSYLYVNAILGDSEKETIVRTRYDADLGLKPIVEFSVDYRVKPQEQWYYLFNYTSIPTNWYDGVSSWSQASSGDFPATEHYLVFYKKQFTLPSVQNSAGVVISLRYQYDVLVYVNGHRVFNKGLTEDLSDADRVATSSLDSIHFRQFSLPIIQRSKTVDEDSTELFKQGTNTIAIALRSKTTESSTFDCAIRLIREKTVSRAFLLEEDVDKCTNTGVLSHSKASISGSTNNNVYQIVLNDDRHDWVTSITIQLFVDDVPQNANSLLPRGFTLEGLKSDGTWKKLNTNQKLMTWSLANQRTKIWIETSESYNQYRFTNIRGNGNCADSCPWRIGLIDLHMDATKLTIDSLDYHYDNDFEIYKGIEMGEIYPRFNEGFDFNYYYNFEFNDEYTYPDGIQIDPNSGIISGQADKEDKFMDTKITAYNYITMKPSTISVVFNVITCSGSKALITLVALSDPFPSESSYQLFKGEETSSAVIREVDTLFVGSNMNYGDFCLDHGFYTLKLSDRGSGWLNPAGYYLTVDVGEMVISMGQIHRNDPSSNQVTRTVMFSSAIPFQIVYTTWSIYRETTPVPAGWNQRDFAVDDRWESLKAADFGTSEAITVYVRKEFDVTPSSSDHVLNVRVKYQGGLVVYLNGKKVARFNLVSDFDATTESIAVHDENTFSKFHVILDTLDYYNERNVIAFEIHRPKGMSSSNPIVFDATGVFGVVDLVDGKRCSIVVDDFLFDTEGEKSEYSKFFSLKPTSFYDLTNSDEFMFEWEVENLEGSQFNSFGIQSVYQRYHWGFSLSGKDEVSGDYTRLVQDNDITTEIQGRTMLTHNIGMVGYKRLKFAVTRVTNKNVAMSTFIFQYCYYKQSKCNRMGEYAPVNNNQRSYAKCYAGMKGYRSVLCQDGKFGEEDFAHCAFLPPSDLQYDSSTYSFVAGTVVHINQPRYVNNITLFSISPELPSGLVIEPLTGAITGAASSSKSLTEYTITGSNPSNSTVSTTISIEIVFNTKWIWIGIGVAIIIVAVLVVGCFAYKRYKQSKPQLPIVVPMSNIRSASSSL